MGGIGIRLIKAKKKLIIAIFLNINAKGKKL
jgi:hypothetical protein